MTDDKVVGPAQGITQIVPASDTKRPSILVRNLGEPIRLTNVGLHGVAAEAARPGSTLKVWTRLALTSDERIFHRIVENLGSVISHHAQLSGHPVALNRADTILLVIRPDETAELWVDTAAVALTISVKNAISAGSAVFERDIADITEMRFPMVNIGPRDRIVCLFRQDWRFALFFDFNPGKNLSVDNAARTLGTLYRSLKYRHIYDTLADKVVFERLVGAGWFPFVEIIGHEFKSLSDACEAGFELSEAESKLIEKFDEKRLEAIFHRCMAKPHFAPKERLLKSAISAYKTKDPIAVIKIVLTEIEGILAGAYKTSTGGTAKIGALLKFAVESAAQKAGAPDTLLFPAAFATYLATHTFANFDPAAQAGSAGSRHAVGHGAAEADSYTQQRALQALLTLDQIAFYT